MKAVVVTFERLHLGFLGCYGNEWVETPYLDRLASEAVVFDQHFGENFDPAAANHAWWTGRYQFPRTLDEQRRQRLLFGVLREAGVTVELFAEEGCSLSEMVRSALPGVVRVAAREERDAFGTGGQDCPSDVQTAFGRLVQRGRRRFEELAAGGDESWLLWLHSRGVPPEAIRPLDRRHQVEYLSSDDWSAIRDRYAAHVRILDRCLGELRAAIAPTVAGTLHAPSAAVESALDAPSAEPLLIVTAAAGESLGEPALLDELRRRLGRPAQPVRDVHNFSEETERASHAAADSLETGSAEPTEQTDWSRLREENVHTPLLIRLPGSAMGSRRRALVQTVDLAPTLLDWFDVGEHNSKPAACPAERLPCEGASLLPVVRDEAAGVRESLCVGENGRCAGVRTEEFYLVTPLQDQSLAPGSARLWIKPDDFWEINEVAEQYPEEVERLTALLGEFLSSVRESPPELSL